MAHSFDQAIHLLTKSGSDEILQSAGLAAISKRHRRTRYDVVMTDMNMPMGSRLCLGRMCNPAVQVPYGFALVLLAVLAGAKFVAMITDSNHHKDAMSAALGHLHTGRSRNKAPVFTINSTRCVLSGAPMLRDAAGNPTCKDWGAVLKFLLSNKKTWGK